MINLFYYSAVGFAAFTIPLFLRFYPALNGEMFCLAVRHSAAFVLLGFAVACAVSSFSATLKALLLFSLFYLSVSTVLFTTLNISANFLEFVLYQFQFFLFSVPLVILVGLGTMLSRSS